MDDALALDIEFLPEDLIGLIKAEIPPEEKLLWVSRSDQDGAASRIRGHALAGLISVLLIVWGAACFAGLVLEPTFWFVIQVPSGILNLGFFCGLIGLVVGFFTLVSPVLNAHDRILCSRRVYDLTDQRAIFWEPVSGNEAFRVRVYPRGSIKPEQIERTEFPDGSGTLSLRGRFLEHGNFEGIAEVRRVEQLVRR